MNEPTDERAMELLTIMEHDRRRIALAVRVAIAAVVVFAASKLLRDSVELFMIGPPPPFLAAMLAYRLWFESFAIGTVGAAVHTVLWHELRIDECNAELNGDPPCDCDEH